MQSSDRHNRLKRLNLIKMFAFIGVLFTLAFSILVIKSFLVSFTLAIVLSYFVSPIIDYLEGAGVSRIIAIIIVYCFFTTSTGMLIWACSPFVVKQIATLRLYLPDYVEGTVLLIKNFSASLENYTGGVLDADLSDRARALLTEYSNSLVQDLPGVLSSSASVLFLSPIIGFFLIKDGHRFSRELLTLVPNNIFELVLSLQHQISKQIGHYIRARIIEALIVGFVVLVGFAVIQFPFAFLLAFFAALANLIPYVGPFFGALPGVTIALLNQADGVTLGVVVGVYVIAQLIDNFIIIPLVVARIVNLHPLTVILAVLLGAQFMGILGMLISIPLASALKVTFASIYTHLTDNSV